jgi:hypothetical protein
MICKFFLFSKSASEKDFATNNIFFFLPKLTREGMIGMASSHAQLTASSFGWQRAKAGSTQRNAMKMPAAKPEKRAVFSPPNSNVSPTTGSSYYAFYKNGGGGGGGAVHSFGAIQPYATGDRPEGI